MLGWTGVVAPFWERVRAKRKAVMEENVDMLAQMR